MSGDVRRNCLLTALRFGSKLGRMKPTLLTLLLLATSAFSQSVSVTNNNGTETLSNTSKKNVVLVAGNLSFNDGKILSPFAHEFLWGHNLFAAGGMQQIPAPEDDQVAKETPIVTFVQFDDGTTWGDPNSQGAQEALARRKAILAYLPKLANAGTVDDFLVALDQPQTAKGAYSMWVSIRMEVKSGGPQTAWGHVKDRWAAAQSRSNLWNF